MLIKNIEEKKEVDEDEDDDEDKFNKMIPENLEQSEKEKMMVNLKQTHLENKNKKKFLEALEHIQTYINSCSDKRFIIMIDVSYDSQFMIDMIMGRLSYPKFILNLNITEEEHLSRYKKMNELEEIPEDTLPSLTDQYKKSLTLKAYLEEKAKELKFIKYFNFENQIPISEIGNKLKLLFKKNFILIVDRFDDVTKENNITKSNKIIKDHQINNLLNLNVLKNEFKIFDLNKCKIAQFEEQKNLNQIISERIHSNKISSDLYFLYLNISNMNQNKYFFHMFINLKNI